MELLRAIHRTTKRHCMVLVFQRVVMALLLRGGMRAAWCSSVAPRILAGEHYQWLSTRSCIPDTHLL
jgi:hypothetical protein